MLELAVAGRGDAQYPARMLNGMDGYKGGIVTAWTLFFIAARLCYVAHHGFTAALDSGWWSSILAATVLAVLWPLPVLLVIAALVWLLPPDRTNATRA